MESLEESLEFFSSDGRPLRASSRVNLTQQKITEFIFRPTSGPGAYSHAGYATVDAGASRINRYRDLADSQGKGDNWQDIAAANNIENPRLLQPGQLLDMNASVGVSFGGLVSGAGASFGVWCQSRGLSTQYRRPIQSGSLNLRRRFDRRMNRWPS